MIKRDGQGKEMNNAFQIEIDKLETLVRNSEGECIGANACVGYDKFIENFRFVASVTEEQAREILATEPIFPLDLNQIDLVPRLAEGYGVYEYRVRAQALAIGIIEFVYDLMVGNSERAAMIREGGLVVSVTGGGHICGLDRMIEEALGVPVSAV